jgi:two-component system, cell cycle response regulator
MLHHDLQLRHDEYLRYGRRYAVLFADIDHFKNVNDSYGHDTGDQALKLVASTLRGCTRISDTGGRWGGEEFLYLAPVTDGTQAIALAERTRHLVHASWLPHDDHAISVTVSIGVALANPNETTTQLVDRADSAMLNAKQKGRNRSQLG